MRNNFNLQLNELHEDLKKMGTLCEDCITFATQSLLLGDTELGERAIQAEKQTDIMEKEIQNLCMRILLQQQPVARDLRQISAALKMITDMERIGDQAFDIADITKSGSFQGFSGKVHIKEMAKAAIHMVTDSVDSYVKQDVQLAKRVTEEDDVVDELFLKVRRELAKLIHTDQNASEQALDLLMIAKYLERIGDHAVNVSEWVIYSVTGKHM